MRRVRLAALLVLLALPVLSGLFLSCRPARSKADARLRQKIFEAEDARAPDVASLDILLNALDDSDPGIRQMAVRALGRLVRPDLADEIALLLSDPDASVRSEAANALAQSVADIRPVGRERGLSAGEAASLGGVFSRLEEGFAEEIDPPSRGVFLRSIGRLSYPDEPSFRRAEKLLRDAFVRNGAGTKAASGAEFIGALKGIEALLRRKARSLQADEALVENLKFLALSPPMDSADSETMEQSARIRRLALTALTWAGRLDEATLEAASSDPDEQVRRLVYFGWGRIPTGGVSAEAAEGLIDRGLADRAGSVRYESLRILGRIRPESGIASVLEALGDDSPHVRLLAIDLLGQTKAASEDINERLKGLAARSDAGENGLTRLEAAHALVSLSRTSPTAAREMLPRFLQSPEWIVRMYAASAAFVLKEVAMLERLTGDPHDNVRNEALSGLIALRGREADRFCLAALERNDHQLILTAVRGLKGSSPAESVPALFSTLARLTAQKRETSRDPRLALVERIGELGTEAQAEELAAYAEDFDPLVAEAAADVVGRWTGAEPAIHTVRPPVVFPRLADIGKLRTARIRVSMAGGGAFELALDVDEAPATAARFASLVRAGYYDGLTFHRIVPNFLIQGGSPGANEYMGDALFLRDESGLASNLRGTVGISTRGRDTGDAQIYINTVDNDRLDHDYCVFARVIAGLNIVDSILEGDAIRRIEIISH